MTSETKLEHAIRAVLESLAGIGATLLLIVPVIHLPSQAAATTTAILGSVLAVIRILSANIKGLLAPGPVAPEVTSAPTTGTVLPEPPVNVEGLTHL